MRQLYYAMSGPKDGEITAFVQTTIKAKQSCGDSCKFVIYYEPVDGSEVNKIFNSVLLRSKVEMKRTRLKRQTQRDTAVIHVKIVFFFLIFAMYDLTHSDK